MSKTEKNYDTGLRVLEVLKILLNKNVSKSELMEIVKENSGMETVYTSEAFIKYFNTLESLGFKIEKRKNVYMLKNALYDVDITDSEKEILTQCIMYIKKLHNKSIEAHLTDFFSRTLKYLPEDFQNEISNAINCFSQNLSEQDNVLKSLESFITDKQQIAVTFLKCNNTKETIVAELRDIIEKEGTIKLVFYDISKLRNKKIFLNSIISINQLHSRIKNNNYVNSVVFNLYGRLAKSYKLKQSEKLIDFESEYITVSNTEEDREALLKRLLKYGENCRIIKPKSFAEEFLSLTDDILKNLEEVS